MFALFWRLPRKEGWGPLVHPLLLEARMRERGAQTLSALWFRVEKHGLEPEQFPFLSRDQRVTKVGARGGSQLPSWL